VASLVEELRRVTTCPSLLALLTCRFGKEAVRLLRGREGENKTEWTDRSSLTERECVSEREQAADRLLRAGVMISLRRELK